MRKIGSFVSDFICYELVIIAIGDGKFCYL